ncbi:MAG: hypothetical protein HY719_05545 [Planctomycetes bacterium]|nr:hypothetical protein [Planctomycetota bacterium]
MPAPCFNFTDAAHRLFERVVAAIPEFAHVDPARVLTTFAQCRSRDKHGYFAKVTPLRFKGGAEETVMRGVRWRWPKVNYQRREMLYLVTYYQPRFQNLPTLAEKLHTVIHEMYHISPGFNGDIRRFPGKNYAHGRSREWYDRQCRHFVDQVLARVAPEHYAFLQHDFAGLESRYGPVTGLSPRGIAPVRA